MNSIITTFEIVDCNKALGAEGIAAKLHLRDACGAQSFWLEGTPAEVEKAKAFMDTYFNGRIDTSYL